MHINVLLDALSVCLREAQNTGFALKTLRCLIICNNMGTFMCFSCVSVHFPDFTCWFSQPSVVCLHEFIFLFFVLYFCNEHLFYYRLLRSCCYTVLLHKVYFHTFSHTYIHTLYIPAISYISVYLFKIGSSAASTPLTWCDMVPRCCLQASMAPTAAIVQ